MLPPAGPKATRKLESSCWSPRRRGQRQELINLAQPPLYHLPQRLSLLAPAEARSMHLLRRWRASLPGARGATVNGTVSIAVEVLRYTAC
jgi:hypothetical protein